MAVTKYTNDPITYQEGADLSSGATGSGLTATYNYAAYPLGQYREENGVGYRFVKMDAGATAAVAKRLAYHVDGTFKVTATVANSAQGAEAGVFVSVIPASNYGWIAVSGLLAGVVTAGTGD